MPIDEGLPSQSAGALIKIDVKGAERLLKTMGESGAAIRREMRAEERRAADLIKVRAASHAGGFALTGRYAGSFRVSITQTGARIRSNDEAAGVKEFAHVGAVTRRAPIRRVGAPRGNPPRALVRARDELEPQVITLVERAVDRALARVRGE